MLLADWLVQTLIERKLLVALNSNIIGKNIRGRGSSQSWIMEQFQDGNETRIIATSLSNDSRDGTE